MKLGFVSAILPELSLEEVVEFAAAEGFDCVELMCWPKGKATRRYAGITHVDASDFRAADAKRIKALMAGAGVAISGLGYYPNPLTPNRREAKVYIGHIRKVIRAASMLGVKQMNTFVGRDHTKSVAGNWPRFKQVFNPLVKYAAGRGVRIGIENCPMLFSGDEWPGGKNLAYCPAIWRAMFKEIPSRNFGLNYDPSHLVWQQIDHVGPLWEFGKRIHHVHAKDVRVDYDRLDDVGVLATPLEYHSPKLPGLGEVDWGRFFSVLGDVGYKGPVCIEVEDRAYEGSLKRRKDALRQSAAYLRQFIPAKEKA